MGKLIICNGKSAEKPYCIQLTNTNIYSIEELCYYIFHHIDSINEDMFSPALTAWMKEELNLEKEGEVLEELLAGHAPLKDMVVSVLCSSDYYTENEIKQLLLVMDEIGRLTPMEKKKKKADNYLKYKQFTKAATEYETILGSSEAAALDGSRYGDLLHNLAIAQLNTVGYGTASVTFREAYERNRNQESLKQYLFTLLLCNQEKKFKQELEHLGVNKELEEEIRNEILIYFNESEISQEYQIINELSEMKDTGRIVPFYQLAGDLIHDWMKEFRLENS